MSDLLYPCKCLKCDYQYKRFPCDLNGRETSLLEHCPSCQVVYEPILYVDPKPCKECAFLTTTRCSCCKLAVCADYLLLFDEISFYQEMFEKGWRHHLNDEWLQVNMLCADCLEYLPLSSSGDFDAQFVICKKNIYLEICFVLFATLKKYNMHDKLFIRHIANFMVYSGQDMYNPATRADSYKTG